MVVELILIPAVTAFIVFNIRNGKLVHYLSTSSTLLTLTYLLIILLFRDLPIVENYVEVSIHEHIEYSFSLHIDNVNVVLLITVLTLLPSIYLYSEVYMRHRVEEVGTPLNLYYGLLLLNTAGIVGVLLSYNMITFVIFYELLVLTSWALVYFYGYGNRVSISLTYLVWSLIASLLIIIGLVGIYVHLDTLSFNLCLTRDIPLWTYYILLIGFAIKMGLAGVHLWLPLTHAEAPTPFSAVLSPLIIGLGGYGVLRILKPLIPTNEFLMIILIWGIASIVYGGIGALVEDDVKRILAYSSISHMGYLTLALSVHDYILSNAAFSYHYLAHAYSKALLFLASGILIYTLNTRNIKLVSGVLRTCRLCGIAFIVGFLSLAGLPPFAGFISKLIIISTILRSATYLGTEFYVLSIIASITMIFSLAYGVRVIKYVVFGTPKPEVSEVKLPLTMSLSIIIIIMLLVVTWLTPHIILGLTVTTPQID
jgi:NADH-quinone oxidoreductase subunit M